MRHRQELAQIKSMCSESIAMWWVPGSSAELAVDRREDIGRLNHLGLHSSDHTDDLADAPMPVAGGLCVHNQINT